MTNGNTSPNPLPPPGKQPDISVVIPVFNEEESVGLLCEKLHQALTAQPRSYEVVLVDDGSTDNTWSMLMQARGQYPHLRIIRFRRNFGQTAALSAGFRESRGKTIVTMDADLQNDPADIPKLMDLIDRGHDVVSGWRKDRKDPFLTRRLPSMLANALISKTTGVYLHDYGCTLKAYRRDIVDNINLYGEMHRFIPALASWVGGSIAEVEVGHRSRQFGKSKYGLSRTLRVVLDLITVKFFLQYSSHPIQIFGKIGFFFGLTGILILLWVALGNLTYGYWHNNEAIGNLVKRPFWVITPFMFILFCLQFIVMGLLAEIQIRTYHESQSKPTYFIKEIQES